MSRYSHYIRRLLTRAIPTADDMPSNYELDRHQKLLSMHRGLLAEYLREHQQWQRTEYMRSEFWARRPTTDDGKLWSIVFGPPLESGMDLR